MYVEIFVINFKLIRVYILVKCHFQILLSSAVDILGNIIHVSCEINDVM